MTVTNRILWDLGSRWQNIYSPLIPAGVLNDFMTSSNWFEGDFGAQLVPPTITLLERFSNHFQNINRCSLQGNIWNSSLASFDMFTNYCEAGPPWIGSPAHHSMQGRMFLDSGWNLDSLTQGQHANTPGKATESSSLRKDTCYPDHGDHGADMSSGSDNGWPLFLQVKCRRAV